MNRLPTTLLRIAIAGVFLYQAVAALITPQAWIGYFPHFLLGYVPDVALLGAWSIVEVIIAVWILSGKHIFIPSVAAAILLCSIVIFNLPLLDIVFRDLGLALAAAALALTSRARNT